MQRKINVIIADDVKAIAKNIQSIIINNERVEKVDIAFDGEEAIQKIINLGADLVFTDMDMPKKNGIEVIEYIMSDCNITKKPNFVLITGNQDISIIKKAQELRFDIEYKPINKNKIEEYINNFVATDNEIEVSKTKTKIQDERQKVKKYGFFKKLLR